MAELINNVKMRLILPNNDQESFVNAINYNFHQLANIANHVDAKRGEKGEQGLPGAQGHDGPKGDRGPGIFTFTGDLSSSDEYMKFINENGISDGDMIMYGGVIYNYDETPTNMDDYINDNSGEDGKNKYINTDMSGDIETKVKDFLSKDIAGSMTYNVINDGGIAFVTPKTVNDMDTRYSGDNARKSMTAVFTTNLDPDETKDRIGGYVNNYSINSLCNHADAVNIRLGYEKFVDKNFATINFKELPEDNVSSLIFDLRDDDGLYKKNIAKYTFNAGGIPIASIGIDTDITSIKLGKLSIESQHGVMHIINSDDKPLGIRGDESITVFSNKSVSIGVPNETKTFIKLDNNNNISILANAADGTDPKSSIVLNGQDPNNARIDIKSKNINIESNNGLCYLNLTSDNTGGDFYLYFQRNINYYNTNVACQCRIKSQNVLLSGGTKTIFKNTLFIEKGYLRLKEAAIFGDVQNNIQNSIMFFGKAEDYISNFSEYMISSNISGLYTLSDKSYFIGTKDSMNFRAIGGLNINSHNGVGINAVAGSTQISSLGGITLHTSQSDITIDSSKDLLLHAAKDIRFLDNNESVVYYGDINSFLPTFVGTGYRINFSFYRFWNGRVICITSWGVSEDKKVYYKNIEDDIADSKTKFELNKLWEYAFNHGLYLGSNYGDIYGDSNIISIPLSSITTDASSTAGEHVVIGAKTVSGKRYLQVVYVHRNGVESGPNKFMGQLFYI